MCTCHLSDVSAERPAVGIGNVHCVCGVLPPEYRRIACMVSEIGHDIFYHCKLAFCVLH